MEKVIRFNPISENEVSFDTIETNWRVVDEFYYQTNKGPIIKGELWKDTEFNRSAINEIIEEKRKLKLARDAFSKRAYQLSNARER